MPALHHSTAEQNTIAALLILLTTHDKIERKTKETCFSLMRSCTQIVAKKKFKAGTAATVINKEFPEVNIPGKGLLLWRLSTGEWKLK